MEIRLLKYFLMIAREEGITRAAEILHITQPTLSRQMVQLEEEVGTKLIIRGTKKISLTSEGMLFKRRAEEILALVDKTENELKSSAELVSGTITIGSGVLAASFTLAKLIKSFHQKYPHVAFDLFTANADVVREQMSNGLIDIGVLLEPIDIVSFDFVRLEKKESYSVIMRADDALAKKDSIKARDLIGKTVILPRRANVQNEINHYLGAVLKKLRVIATSNFSTNAAIMVESGIGYTIGINGAIPFMDKNILIEKPLNPPLTSTSVIAWKRHPMQNIATAKFIEHIKENAN